MRTDIVKFIAPHVPPLPDDKVTPNLDTCCAFSGEKISEGVALNTVIKPATANLADTFKYPSDFVSRETATVFNANRELRGNLFITEELGIVKPLVSIDSAEKYECPTWIETFHHYYRNYSSELAVFILTKESKRRLWPDACVTGHDCLPPITMSSGAIAPFKLFLNTGQMSRLVTCNLCLLMDCIKLVQTCLTWGFSKTAIQRSLFSQPNIVNSLEFPDIRDTEKKLSAIRLLPEFAVAIFIGTVTKGE